MRRTFTALLLVCASPSAAMAQTDPAANGSTTMAGDPLTKENWPSSGVDRPLGLSAGMLQVDVNGMLTVAKGAVALPITLPLSVRYGVTDELQVGLVHTTELCVSGKDSECGEVYDDLGLRLLYSVFGRGTPREIALTAQFNFMQFFEPMKLSLQLGTAVKFGILADNLALLIYPSVSIGLNERAAPSNNGDWIHVPFYAYARVTKNVTTVINLSASTRLSDSRSVSPIGLGLMLALNTMMDVGARFDLTNVLGDRPAGVDRFDGRALLLWLSLRPL
jgi:hypothetical protein